MAEVEEPASVPVDDDDDKLSLLDKWQVFLKMHWRGLVCVFTPLLFLGTLHPFPPKKYQICAYTLYVMAVFWVTECAPLAVTSFLPLLVFPTTGVMTTEETCKCYVNDTIIMFVGSLMLACAVEQSGLHRRMALAAVRAIGCSHYRLLFAISFTTMFVSMWITNTAATTMMVPIIFAILQVFEGEGMIRIFEPGPDGELTASDITTCYFCTITYSATIGGIGTLVGTVTNLVFKGLFMETYIHAPEYLSFPNFSGFAIPYMVLMEALLYLNMLVQYFGFLRPKSKAAARAFIPAESIITAKKALDDAWNELGSITFWEVSVIVLFSSAMILFFCRSPQVFFGWGDQIPAHFHIDNTKFVKDSSAAMLVAFLMLLLPSSLDLFKTNKTDSGEERSKEVIPSVLRWREMNQGMPYGFMFLLGAGFALSEAASKRHTNLNAVIGEILRNLRPLPNHAIILIIIIITVFITNFASNVAVCTVVAPIAMKMAEEVHVNPLWYDLAAGFSASYCFMLPVGTPGNLIVQGAAKIPTHKMMIAGIGPTVMAVVMSWLAICFWAPCIWPDLHHQQKWIMM